MNIYSDHSRCAVPVRAIYFAEPLGPWTKIKNLIRMTTLIYHHYGKGRLYLVYKTAKK